MNGVFYAIPKYALFLLAEQNRVTEIRKENGERQTKRRDRGKKCR